MIPVLVCKPETKQGTNLCLWLVYPNRNHGNVILFVGKPVPNIKFTREKVDSRRSLKWRSYRLPLISEGAVWPSGWGACLEIRRFRVQDPLWSLVEFVPGSPWFNFLAAFVNSRLVCLRPVGILNSSGCCVPSFS